MKRVGVLSHPKLSTVDVLLRNLELTLREHGVDCWSASDWEEPQTRARIPGSDLIVTLGGDGTILRAARTIVPHAIPILAVNLGKQGFLTEVAPERAVEELRRALAGEGWIERRMMLEAEVFRTGAALPFHDEPPPPMHALNDVVVGRGTLSRVVDIRAVVNGALFTNYTGDGIIAASPTGSTGYAMSAGGPILHPEMDNLLLTPIAPYLTFSQSVVLPASVEVELAVHTETYAVVSIDGQVEVELRNGDVVQVRRSPYVTRFLRLRPPSYFLRALSERLGREVRPCWLNSPSPTSP